MVSFPPVPTALNFRMPKFALHLAGNGFLQLHSPLTYEVSQFLRKNLYSVFLIICFHHVSLVETIYIFDFLFTSMYAIFLQVILTLE